MTAPQPVDLTLSEAARLLDEELRAAKCSLEASEAGVAQDRFVSALGLALQLGPAPVQEVLLYVMDATHRLAQTADSESLSTMGPALVLLVGQVRQAGALPPTAAMEAWATLATDLGVIIGQLGLALSMKADRRAGILANARLRAGLLDDATEARFGFTTWLDQLLTGS